MSCSAESTATSASFPRDENSPSPREPREGPRVVTFGGGTGMAALLKGLKSFRENITAVVTVTDNGGSSGRLRNDFDIAAPGDIRNCLLALADIDPLIARSFQYRFEEAEFKDHCFGNLFITVLARLVGDFGVSIRELNRLFNVRGQVLPGSGTRVSLVAHHPDGSKSTGEVQITKSGKAIQQVEVRPSPVPLSDDIRTAIAQADLFLFGPGSLYTSVLPNLLIDGLVEAIEATGSPRVYIANLMTQPGETDGYSLSDHIRALVRHVGPGFPDAVVAHRGDVPDNVLRRYRESGAEPVVCDMLEHDDMAEVRLIFGDFCCSGSDDSGWAEPRTASPKEPPEAVRHDSFGLARVIYDEFLSRGPTARAAVRPKAISGQDHDRGS